jgi:hypothetical protein
MSTPNPHLITEMGIATIEATDEGGPLGNAAYYEWLEATIKAGTRRDVPWIAVELAIILDRSIRAEEAAAS